MSEPEAPQEPTKRDAALDQISRIVRRTYKVRSKQSDQISKKILSDMEAGKNAPDIRLNPEKPYAEPYKIPDRRWYQGLKSDALLIQTLSASADTTEVQSRICLAVIVREIEKKLAAGGGLHIKGIGTIKAVPQAQIRVNTNSVGGVAKRKPFRYKLVPDDDFLRALN